ncbi:MAG TPA: hypothetical protein VD978_31500 [Azospirillum sp.]|nr:hypothetical protein [Azospirillum sp.]
MKTAALAAIAAAALWTGQAQAQLGNIAKSPRVVCEVTHNAPDLAALAALMPKLTEHCREDHPVVINLGSLSGAEVSAVVCGGPFVVVDKGKLMCPAHDRRVEVRRAPTQ